MLPVKLCSPILVTYHDTTTPTFLDLLCVSQYFFLFGLSCIFSVAVSFLFDCLLTSWVISICRTWYPWVLHQDSFSLHHSSAVFKSGLTAFYTQILVLWPGKLYSRSFFQLYTFPSMFCCSCTPSIWLSHQIHNLYSLLWISRSWLLWY